MRALVFEKIKKEKVPMSALLRTGLQTWRIGEHKLAELLPKLLPELLVHDGVEQGARQTSFNFWGTKLVQAEIVEKKRRIPKGNLFAIFVFISRGVGRCGNNQVCDMTEIKASVGFSVLLFWSCFLFSTHLCSYLFGNTKGTTFTRRIIMQDIITMHAA